MEYKIISSEIIYIKKTVEHIIDINGKQIRAYEYQMQDEPFDQYDHDIEIDEQDKEKLTDEELEELEDNLKDLITE